MMTNSFKLQSSINELVLYSPDLFSLQFYVSIINIELRLEIIINQHSCHFGRLKKDKYFFNNQIVIYAKQ